MRSKATQPGARGRPLSPRTVGYLHAILRAALAAAVRDDLVARNVAALVTPPAGARPADRVGYLDADQARALLHAAEGDRPSAPWRLALTAGLRKGELLALRWADVDLDRGELTVRRTIGRHGSRGLVEGAPKTKDSRRVVRLGPGMVEALRRHRVRQAAERLAAGARWQESGRVFTTATGTTIDPRNLNRVLDRLCRRAEVPVSACTTCATPARRCCSPRASRSK